MNVVFLTEGGTGIGFGHIMRCMSICEAFEEKGESPEFIVNGDESVFNLLHPRRSRIFNWLERMEETVSLIKDTDIVIIDSYLADSDFYDRVSKVARCPLYLDDNKRIDYPKGIVLNGALNAGKLGYPERQEVIHLLGSGYSLLRKAFRDVLEKVINERIETVMITFGGDDTGNMTPAVLGLLSGLYSRIIKNVIIGRGFRNAEGIEAAADGRTELHYYPDAEKMRDIMVDSDIAVSAGGQTLYELARVGVPTIAVAVADNQMNNVTGWRESGFIEYAGWWEDDMILNNMQSGLKRLEDKDKRRKMSQMGRTLVDGKGAGRVVELLLEKKRLQ